jgi:subfamily B ATP-binding cassette protein MsbA
MKLYIRLLKYLKPHLTSFIPAVICMALLAITSSLSLTTIVPITQLIFEQPSVDSTITSQHYEFSLKDLSKFDKRAVMKAIGGDTKHRQLAHVCVFIIIIFFIKNIFLYGQSYYTVKVEQGVIRDFRDEIYQKYHQLPLSFFHGRKAGELISRVTNDVTLVRGAVGYGLADLVKNLFLFIFYMALALWASWRMALAALVVFPPSLFLITLLGRKLRVNSIRTQEKMASVTTVLQETVSGIRVVKAFGMEKFEISRFKKYAHDYYKTMVKLTRISAFGAPLTELLGVLAGALILWYGGRQILSGGSLTTSTFLLFILAAFSMMDPIKKLSQANMEIQQGLAAAQRLFEIIDTPPAIADKPNALTISSISKSVKYENVGFTYGKREFKLENIDFELGKGEILALVGPSGGGKSTIVDLLPRFYDPTEGRITIDGTDIRDLSLGSLRSMMGIVTQETILFNDTIANNIAYGQKDTPIDKIKEVARTAFADEFIMKMPNGYDTIIGDRGVKLSGGQKQRLAIARALFKDPPILIFDEATSALDTESEILIQKAIDNLLTGRTVIVIAHRLSTIRGSSQILMINNGKIVERGTHADLLNQNGLYKKLHDMQFSEPG